MCTILISTFNILQYYFYLILTIRLYRHGLNFLFVFSLTSIIDYVVYQTLDFIYVELNSSITQDHIGLLINLGFFRDLVSSMTPTCSLSGSIKKVLYVQEWGELYKSSISLEVSKISGLCATTFSEGSLRLCED